MAQHYNAFISYRHTPRDMACASRIQRMLEHFRIPRAIQKQTGIRKIEHIFRDKEDLSITSDLNDTIHETLGDSDFLIVICSPESKASPWVQKEIEFFLQTHTRAQIFTVISAGEPEDVIPDILCYEDVVAEDEYGCAQTVRIQREPLCCDFRLPPRRAKREELPRLAAAMIGCSYDDLRQRQRQYRVRRTAVVLSVLFVLLSALASYFAWSAGQIRKNYEQALINQSQYLASESQKHLSGGDRLTAMLLALAALPESTQDADRPVVPIAIDALVQASYAYVSPGANTYALQHAYPHTGAVDQLVINSDGSRLFTVSGLYTATLWDADNKTALFHQKYPFGVQQIICDAQGNFLLLTDEITCIEGKTGAVLWTYTPPAGQYLSGYLSCADDRVLAACATARGVIVLDTYTGQLVCEYKSYDDADRSVFCANTALSSDGKYLAAASLSGDTILIWDVESGTCRSAQNPMIYVCDMTFDQEGNLFVNVSSSMNMNLSYGDELYLTGHRESIVKISPQGRILFASEYSHAQSSYLNEILFLRYEEPSGEAYDAVIVASGNCCHVFDQNTGNLIRRIEFPAPLVSVEAHGLQITAILCDGQRAYYHCANGIIKTTHCFVEDIRSACIAQGCIFLRTQGSESVLLYRTGVYDSAWSCVLEDGAREHAQLDAGLLVLSEQGELSLLSDTGQITWSTPLAMEECLLFDVIGQSENGESAVLNVYGRQDAQAVVQTYICLVDLQDGTQEFLTVDSTAKHFTITGDRLCYTVEQDGTCFVGMFRLATHSLEVVELEQMLAPNGLFASENRMVVSTHDGEYYLVEKDGTCTLLFAAQTPPPVPLVIFDDDGRVAVFADDALCIFDKKNEPVCQIPLNGQTLRDASFDRDEIFFVTADGKLNCHDAASGAFIGETDVIGAEFAATQTLWQWEEDTLFLRLGDGLNVVDLSHFQVLTRVEACSAYFTQTRLLYTLGQSSDGYNRIGTFTLYETDTLIARALDQLDGLTLTPQQCAEFGVTQ